MHTCFILDNSLTMAQKSANNLSILDQTKSSIQFVFRSLIKANKFSSEDIVHLFVTSSVEPLSSFEHSQLHFLHQLKSIQFNIVTYPAEVISSALNQIGKFRSLNESETLLGYRQGTIFQPCLIIFLTDRSSVKHLSKINKYLSQNKFAIRSEYQFLVIKFCSPSPSQRNIYTFQVFKARVQCQKESQMMKQITQKMNGKLKFAYSCQQLNQILLKSIQGFKPNLMMQIINKQYKIYSKDFSKTQIELFQSRNLFQKLLKKKNKYFREQSSQKQDKILIKTIPTKKRSLIPIPFQTSSKWINNQHVFDKFFNIKLSVDFSKELTGLQVKNGNYYIDKYNILHNAYLKQIESILSSQENNIRKFPLFYQKKNQQHLIGYLQYLRIKPNLQNQGNQSHPQRQQVSWSLNISFANFTNLVSCFKLLHQNNRNININQLFQNYLSTLPNFYIKFIQCFLQPFKLNLSYQTFQNIHHTSVGINNLKLYELRGVQKKGMNAAYWKSKQSHQKCQTQCCSIYSQNFNSFQQKYSNQNLAKTQFQNKIQQFLNKNIKNFSQIKKKIGIEDYLTIKEVQSFPISKQLEKYNIRRGDDDFNQNATSGFGNPFKKRRKLNSNSEQTESSQFVETDLQLKFADQTNQQHLAQSKYKVFTGQSEQLKVQKTIQNNKFQNEMQQENIKITQQGQSFEKNMMKQKMKQKEKKQNKKKKQELKIIEFVNNFKVIKPVLIKISKINIKNNQYERNMKIISQQKQKNIAKK